MIDNVVRARLERTLKRVVVHNHWDMFNKNMMQLSYIQFKTNKTSSTKKRTTTPVGNKNNRTVLVGARAAAPRRVQLAVPSAPSSRTAQSRVLTCKT